LNVWGYALRPLSSRVLGHRSVRALSDQIADYGTLEAPGRAPRRDSRSAVLLAIAASARRVMERQFGAGCAARDEQPLASTPA
jgi:hypothetical protein